MSASADTTKRSSKSGKPKSHEEIIMGFQKLRTEQRYLTNKLSELELELHEHRIVIQTLKTLEGDRKCFRMIGGILCERTVKDVLPILKSNEENLSKVVESLNIQLIEKGVELNKYKEENNVRFKNVDEINPINEADNTTTNSGAGSTTGSGGGGGVLVS